MDSLIVIPARGGSKRIPRKNVKDFNGAPIIQWTISAAIEAVQAPNVIVSTEDTEVAAVTEAAGATAPFIRPTELADDHVGTAPVIVHALDTLAVSDDTAVMCLYPTAVLSAALVTEALAVGLDHADDFVVSLGRHRSPLERAVGRTPDGKMGLLDQRALLSRTQDLPQRFFDAGKLYMARAAVWRSRTTMMSEPFVPFFLPDWASVDIDEPSDWLVAEAMHRAFVLEDE